MLVEIWQRISRTDIVDGDFFQSGGDGVAAADLLSLVEDAVAVKVPMAEFVDRPILAALISAVHDRIPEEPGSNETGVGPVAPSQEGMLWHEQFAPGSFNLPPMVRRYQGHLDVDCLRQSLSEIVRRHPPLRTTFTVTAGRPVQRVGSHQPLIVPITDLRGLADSSQRNELARAVADAAVRPFNLEQGPLFEPQLFRLAQDDHVLLIRLHHLAFDDWSVNVFRRNLAALYCAKVAGTAPDLPKLELDFADFCRHQRRSLAGRAGAEELSWWRRELEGAPFTVGLPIGDPDRPEGSPHRAPVPLELPLPPAVVERLRNLACEERTTLFMTMLSVFSMLVQRLTGQDDLLMASVVANRGTTAVEPLIGCFTKKILLRIRLSGDPTFRELMGRVRTTVLGALAHQELSYEMVLQEVMGAAAAAQGVVPDVSLMFQAEVQHKESLSLPGLRLSAYETGSTVEQPHFAAGDADAGGPPWGSGLYRNTFLILSLSEGNDGVSLLARGAFHPPAVEAFLGCFAQVAGEIIARPERRLSELAIGISQPRSRTATGQRTSLRGYSVEPGRIAAALERHPGVDKAAVVVEGDAPEVRRLVAYIVPRAQAGTAITLADLRSFLWSQLPGYAWPTSLILLATLPSPDEGAVDAFALRPSVPAGRRASTGEPLTGEERLLCSIWGDVLGTAPVGVDANYWQKFSFVEVVRRAAGAGLPISAQQVRRNRTLRTLAADLAASRIAAGTRLPASRSKPVSTDPSAGNGKLRDTAPSPLIDAALVPGAEEVIRTEGLTKTYPGGRVAVHPLDLRLVAGEILGVLGPNGAGKTTTVGMLTGKVIPTGGHATVKGIDVVAHPAAAKQHMGLVQQGNTLDRGLNVWENLYFHARYFGMGSKQAQAATDEVLEKLHLVGRESGEVHTLSGGFVRRVMLARAILHRPAVLFLDEPTAGLDPQTRLALWEILGELRSTGQTIFMTTHYMEEADRLADRVAIIDHGRILALDTPAGLKKSMGHGATLTVRAEGDMARLAVQLKSMTGASDVQQEDGGFRVRLASAEDSLIKVMAAAEHASCRLTDLSVLEDTLENVFINLTGRDLRE